MNKSERASNNACGTFLVALVFFVLLLALNHVAPRPGTGWLLAFVAAVGLGALAVWTWLSVKAVLPADD